MEILTKSELQLRFEEIANKIEKGTLFVHPTDTIYGLGCNALDEKAVHKMRQVKQNNEIPFSVWAPSIEWIQDNCEVDQKAEEWLDKLPGPYTLVLKLKNKKAVARSVNMGKDTIGVRLPQHWLSQAVKVLNFPLVTTSANPIGKKVMTKLENLDPSVEISTEFAIYEGEKESNPSKIVDLVAGKVKER